jgi:hypothetical protein
VTVCGEPRVITGRLRAIDSDGVKQASHGLGRRTERERRAGEVIRLIPTIPMRERGVESCAKQRRVSRGAREVEKSRGG